MEAFPETVKTQPELRGHHLAQAGLAEKTIEYLRKAGVTHHWTLSQSRIGAIEQNKTRLKRRVRRYNNL
jgi:hypothetical protein